MTTLAHRTELPPTRAEMRHIAQRQAWRVVAICAWACFIGLVVYGCAHKKIIDGSIKASDNVARTELRAQQIKGDAQAVKPRTDKVGQVYVSRIIVNADGVGEDMEGVRKGLADMQAAYQGALDTIERRTKQYEALNSKWYVWTGRWIERLLIVGIVAWVALGLFGTYFVGTAGVVGRIAKFVLNFIPASNVFAAIANKKAA